MTGPPTTMNQETALYYSQIACDKMILNCTLRLKYLKNGGSTLGPNDEKLFTDLINEFEEVKEYLKENLH